MIGQTVEKYKIEREIGQGGMAVVYSALDTRLKRQVALKILHPHLMRQEEAVKRFQREAVTVAKLHHPNIIEIYDYSGENSAYRYIVTELIDGMTLAAFLDRHDNLPCELVACVSRELCLALDHAHQQGIVHRDLKPENVMIRQDGKIKLMDFGIARAIEGATMTMTGSILGSPAFMSPEHVGGKDIDFRSDLFSLGGILYFLTTGELPFAGRNPHEFLKKIVEGDYIPAQELNPTVSNEFDAILNRLLQVDPADRYQSVQELLQDLDRVIQRTGIDNPTQEVHKLFQKPEQYLKQFTENLVESLERQAARYLKRKPALAMQIYNRLLAYRPDHAEATRQIELILSRQQRQERVKRWILAGAILVFIATLGRWGVHSLPQATVPGLDIEAPALPMASYPDEQTEEIAKEPTVPQRTLAKAGRIKPGLQAGESPVKKLTPAKLERLKPGKQAQRSSNVVQKAVKPLGNFTGSLKVVTAPWADIYIDDKLVGNYPLNANDTFSLKAGEHVVRLINPNCEPYSETVRVEKANQQIMIRRRLRIKPAFMELNTDEGTMIFVDGKFRGRAPLKKPLMVNWDEHVSSKEVLLSLTKEGYEPQNQRVKLQAGETRDLSVKLKKK